MYAKVTKLIKWKNLSKWLLQRITRLKSLKHHQMSGCLLFINASFVTVHRTLLCGQWLYIQWTESEIVFPVGWILQWIKINCNQYNETNMMQFLFNLLRIKSLYMFRPLPAHPQEVLPKRHLLYCMHVMSVGCTRIGVELVPVPLQSCCSQLK
jgi:hypothetical protein